MSAVLRQAGSVRQRVHWSDRVAHLALALIAATLAAFLAGPLLAVLVQSVEGKQGEFVALDNFFVYFGTPALADSLWNSVWVAK